MYVTSDIYKEKFDAFLREHKGLKSVFTGGISEVRSRIYFCNDGAEWFEEYSSVQTSVPLKGQVFGVSIERLETVKFFCTKFCNTDDSRSFYVYKKY